MPGPASISAQEAKKLDEKAKELGLEERVLIENASSNLCEIIDGLRLGKSVCAVAGRGNNGADVLACARKLASRGYKVNVAIASNKELGQQALAQRKVLENIKIPIHSIDVDNIDDFQKMLKGVDFIVEGILGIGLRGEVSSYLNQIITAINASGKKIVACDIPSGLCPQAGVPLGTAVMADYTVTFLSPKEGFFLNQASRFCGRIFTVDIGVSHDVLEKL
jgi:NAD(P)H-hydrate epimerase